MQIERMGIFDLSRTITHFKKDCDASDETILATVKKPDGTEMVKMMCRNCGKIFIDIFQVEPYG